ncbi:hypothetical protein [Halalkalibaculum sp. DA384]|uniref:hypothetical protein n=1 Tax=Halalkalibaculum sp. DA384 TaxID=3373606 RepID=UPI003754A6D2
MARLNKLTRLLQLERIAPFYAFLGYLWIMPKRIPLSKEKKTVTFGENHLLIWPLPAYSLKLFEKAFSNQQSL